MAVAVKITGERLLQGADRGPAFNARQVDVGRQLAADAGLTAVDLAREPKQLAGVADEVDTVFILAGQDVELELGRLRLQAVVGAVEAVGVREDDGGLTLFDRAFLPGHIVRDIPLETVGQLGNDLHAGGVERLAGLIGHLLRAFRDLNGQNLRGDGHHVAGVVLVVDRAGAVCDGGADTVLCQRSLRREDLAVAGIRGRLRLSLARAIHQDGNAAGGVVVGEVDEDIAVARAVAVEVLVDIGRGDHGRGLRIADDAVGIGIAHFASCSIQINDLDAVAAVLGELALAAGNAEVDAPVVDGRRAGGHDGTGLFLTGVALGVLECQRLEVRDLAGFPVDGGIVDVAALGREEHAVRIRVVGNVGADITLAAVVGVEQLACQAVEDQQGGGVDIVTLAGAVVRADDAEVIRHISACPVEAADAGIGPGGELGFIRLHRVLVRHGDGNEVAGLALAVPEADIDVAVVVCRGGIGLAAERIGVDPQGFERLGVEGLDLAAGQADKDHAVGIGCRVDGEAGGTCHRALCEHLAGVDVEALDGAAGVGDEVTVHQNGGAGSGRPACAVLRSPQQLTVLTCVGRGGVRDAKVIAAVAEVRPFGGEILDKGRVLFGCGQRDLEHWLGRAGSQAARLADIALCRCDIGVGCAVHQGIIAVLIRIDAGVERVIQDQQGVLRVKLCTHLADGVLRCLDGVGGRQAVSIGDDDGHDVLAVLQGPFAGLRAVVGHGVAVLIWRGAERDGICRRVDGVFRRAVRERLVHARAGHVQGRQGRSAERGERVGLRIAVNADRQGDGVRLGIAAEVREALAGGLAGRNGRGLGFAVIQIRPLGLDGGAFRGIFGQRGPQEGAEAVRIGDCNLIFGRLTVEFRREGIVTGTVISGQTERGQVGDLLTAAAADAVFADIVAESRNLFRLRLAAGRAGVGLGTGLGAGRVDRCGHFKRVLALAFAQLLPGEDGVAAVDLLHAGAVSLEGSAELRDEVGGLHGLCRHLCEDGRIVHCGIVHLAETFEAAGEVVDVFHFEVAVRGIIRVHQTDRRTGVDRLQTKVGHGADIVAVVNVALLIGSRGAGVELADQTADAAVVLVAVAGDRAGVVAVDDVARAVRGVGAAADRADETADIAVAGDGTGVIAARKRRAVAHLAKQTADALIAAVVGCKADRAGVVGVDRLRGLYGAAKAADLRAAGDRTVVHAGGVGRRLTLGREAGDIVAVRGHGAVVDAAQEVCILHRTGKAADIAPRIGGRALLRGDGNVRRDIGEGNIFRTANEAAGIGVGIAVVLGDVELAGERQVPDLRLLVSRALDIAEEAEIGGAAGGGGIGDVHAGDAVAVAVKAAGERLLLGAHRGPRFGQLDIGSQLAADGGVAAVDLRCEPLQLLLAGNAVDATLVLRGDRGILRAAAGAQAVAAVFMAESRDLLRAGLTVHAAGERLDTGRRAGGLRRDDAFIPLTGLCIAAGEDDLCRCGGVAGVLRAVVRVIAQQVIGTGLQRGRVERVAAAFARKLLLLFPVFIVELHIETGDRLKGLRAAVGHGLGVILLRFECDLFTDLGGVVVLVKAGECAVGPEAPVGEHGQIDRVVVGQQNVVCRGAPARRHQGIDVVAVVHEVLVMAPEVLHVHGRGAAGDEQRIARILIGAAEHVIHAFAAAGEFQQAGCALAAVLLGHAEVVALEHIDVEVQERRALHDLVVRIASGAVLRVVTVKIVQTVQGQGEVRDLDLQMRQDGAAVVLADDRCAVARDGHIDGDGGLVGLVIAVLVLVAVLHGLDRDGNGDFGAAAARAGSGNADAEFPCLGRGELQRIVLDIDLIAVIRLQREAESVPVRVGEHRSERELVQRTDLDGIGRRGTYRDVAVRREDRGDHRQKHGKHQQDAQDSFHAAFLSFGEPTDRSSAADAGAFSPIHRFGKFGVLRSRWRLCRLTDAACPLRVHKVRLHFPNLDSTKNLSVSTLEDTISGFPDLFIFRPLTVKKIKAAKKQPDRKLHGRHGVFGKLLHRGAGRRHPTRPQEENTRSCAAGTHPLPRIGHKKTAERIDRLSPQPIRAK